MKNQFGVNTKLKVVGNKVEIWDDCVLLDHYSDQDVADMVDFLMAFQNRPREQYYLWKGDQGTIIHHLTTEEDLPSITIGGGGKREKFTPITGAFVKDANGNFKEF